MTTLADKFLEDNKDLIKLTRDEAEKILEKASIKNVTNAIYDKIYIFADNSRVTIDAYSPFAKDENKFKKLSKAKFKNLVDNINQRFAHATLEYRNNKYSIHLHGGHAGNCGCGDHPDVVWVESSVYTDPKELKKQFIEAGILQT